MIGIWGSGGSRQLALQPLIKNLKWDCTAAGLNSFERIFAPPSACHNDCKGYGWGYSNIFVLVNKSHEKSDTMCYCVSQKPHSHSPSCLRLTTSNPLLATEDVHLSNCAQLTKKHVGMVYCTFWHYVTEQEQRDKISAVHVFVFSNMSPRETECVSNVFLIVSGPQWSSLAEEDDASGFGYRCHS